MPNKSKGKQSSTSKEQGPTQLAAPLLTDSLKRSATILAGSEGRTTSLDAELKGWGKQPTMMFMACFQQGRFNQRLLQLDHFVDRMRSHLQILESTTMTTTAQRMSDFWGVVHALHRIRLEFGAEEGFLRRLMVAFDSEVRTAIGGNFLDGNRQMNHAPWTSVGFRHVKEYVHHLQSISDEDPVLQSEYGCDTIIAAVEELRKYDHSLGSIKGTAGDLSEEQVQRLRKVVEKKVLGEPKGTAWWSGGPLCRAFAIGVKDLFVLKDYKALTFVITAAQGVELRDVGQDGDANLEALWWLNPWIPLAGPHVVKFAGDSDSVREFGKGLQMVQDQVLPRFLGQLVLLRSELMTSLNLAAQVKASVLGGFMAAGPLLFRHFAGSQPDC